MPTNRVSQFLASAKSDQAQHTHDRLCEIASEFEEASLNAIDVAAPSLKQIQEGGTPALTIDVNAIEALAEE